jgi:diaminopimelate decarboxylase
MSDNVRTALYGAEYSARIANRASVAAPALVRVAGKHCESGDIVVDAEYLPGDVAPGDLLAVPATGAYCWSLSSNYNYLPRPAVVAVRDGSAMVIVRGESEDDLLAHDVGVSARDSAGRSAATHEAGEQQA